MFGVLNRGISWQPQVHPPQQNTHGSIQVLSTTQIERHAIKHKKIEQLDLGFPQYSLYLWNSSQQGHQSKGRVLHAPRGPICGYCLSVMCCSLFQASHFICDTLGAWTCLTRCFKGLKPSKNGPLGHVETTLRSSEKHPATPC